MFSRTALLTICLLILVAALAPGQEFRALISGVVTDPSGAAIPGAKVTATNMATNVRSTTNTGENGTYALPQLPTGRYELTVEATGFRPFTRRGITLNVGDKANVAIAMEIGTLAESVTVTAELTGIERNESVMGQLMNNRMVSELPLNGRQTYMLLQLSSGVLFTQQQFGAQGFSGTNPYGVHGEFSIHGSATNTNAFLLDGAPLGVDGRWSYAPLVDAVEEFKVEAPTADASQGLSGGGVINMTMKSGTNQTHGLVSHFLRNQLFDALTTQTNRAAASQPALKVNQHQWNDFAGVLGGAIIKNKLFYSGNYEGFRERVPFPVTVTIPTVEQRLGDFTKTFNSAGQVIVIYDPTTTRQVGSTFVRDAFAGNRLPADRMATPSKNIAALFPMPNAVYDPLTNVNNYASIPNVGKYRYDAYHAKVNYVWNNANRTSASQTFNHGSEYRGKNGLKPPLVQGGDWPRMRDHMGATLDHVYTMNPTTVINARIAWDRYIDYSRQDSIKGYEGDKLGFTGRIGSAPTTLFPDLRLGGSYTRVGPVGADYPPHDVYSAVADVSKTITCHLFKFGARIGQARFSSNPTGDWMGRFDFSAAWTQRDPQRADSTSGNSFASFLLGYPASGDTDVNPATSYQNKFIGLYIQDDIKVTRKLTVNLGLRWDVQTPPTERFNRIIWGFDPNVTYQLGGAQARGGYVFADKDHRQPWDTNYRDFQPRSGVAYQVTRKTVVRAGYGISFLPLNGTGGAGGIQTTGYARRTPMVTTIGGGVNSYIPGLPGTGTFVNPFPDGILQPFGAGLGPKTQVGSSVTSVDRNYQIPRVHQFNVGLDLELPGDMLLKVSYVGTRTRKLPVSKDLDSISKEEQLKGFADPTYLNAAVPNPFAGAPELVGTGLSGATMARSRSLVPYPQFSGVSLSGVSVGFSSYNALETRLNKRFSHGLTLTTTYTWEKILDATNYRYPWDSELTRVLSGNDRTHNLTLFALYELPFGRGHRFGSNWGRALDLPLGHWQTNVSYEWRSGTPTSMPGATPIRDPRLPDSQKSYSRWFNTCTLLTNGTRSNCISADEPITWVQLKPNELTTFSPIFPNLRNPWEPVINLSVFKIFPVHEGVTLEFRAEAFNAFNSPIYAGPNTSVTSSQFGVVTRDQQNFARNMQFALRLRF